MPVSTSSKDLSALIGFTLPKERLDHDESRYVAFDPTVQRPFEKVRVPLIDLRPRITASKDEVLAQLRRNGFAVARHQSTLLDSIPSEEGTAKYLDECCE